MNLSLNFFLIQYSWILIISIFSVFLLQRKFPHKTGQFHLSKPFCPQNPPIILLHLSDLHVSSIKEKSYPRIKYYLNISKELLKPDKIIISGDLTDNYVPTNILRPYHAQYENDWISYSKIMKELNLETSIQVVGNHDMFCLSCYDSPNNYALKYVLYKDENSTKLNNYKDFDDFQINSKLINFPNNGNYKINFISINQFNFPSGPICFVQEIFMTNAFKDRLRKAITNQKMHSNMTIIVSHFPVMLFFHENGLIKILKESDNTRFFLSGHWHPKKTFRLHFGRSVYEVVSPALFKHSSIGVISIDNDVSTYHLVDLDKPKAAFISHPSSIYEKSELDSYSPTSGEVRAIAFCPTYSSCNIEKFNLSISGDINGRLLCSPKDKIKEGVYLCKLPYFNLSEGVHNIDKIGDWDGSLTFSIGPASPSLRESPYLNFAEVSWTTFYFFSWLIAIYILLPFCQRFQQIPIHKTDFKVIYRSFQTVKARVHFLPFYFQAILVMGVLWSFFLPISFFGTEGSLNIFHAFGNFFFVNGIEYRYHYMGSMYGVYFLYFHVFPIFIIANGYRTSSIIVHIIDFIIFLFSLRGFSYQFFWLIDMFGLQYSLLNPLMLWIPIVLYGYLLFWLYSEYKSTKEAEETPEFSSSIFQV